jgi:hypothetical protein
MTPIRISVRNRVRTGGLLEIQPEKSSFISLCGGIFSSGFAAGTRMPSRTLREKELHREKDLKDRPLRACIGFRGSCL